MLFLTNPGPVRLCAVLLIFLGATPASAWDYHGHRIVTEIALESLPPEFPAFIRAPKARERVRFLSGEPDRWRNTTDLPLKHCNGPDHFLDIEFLADYGMRPETVSHFRYEFTAQMAVARAAHPAKFPAADPAADADRTKSLIGFLPWTITEYYAKLKSEFSCLKVFEELGTPGEIANARANIIYTMGMMSHFVGDAAQPLHTTKHYNGWVGGNPNGYTTSRGFHQWMDGGFIEQAGIVAPQILPRVRPARIPWDTNAPPKVDVFSDAMAFLLEQHARVEPLYRMEKEGQLAVENESAKAGRAFIEARLLDGGQFLGDLWFAAWRQAHSDNFLRRQLLKRKESFEATPGRP